MSGVSCAKLKVYDFVICNLHLCIYIYAFSRRFYPKRLTNYIVYTFSLVSVFPGNRTHNLLRCWRNALPLRHTGTHLFYLETCIEKVNGGLISCFLKKENWRSCGTGLSFMGEASNTQLENTCGERERERERETRESKRCGGMRGGSEGGSQWSCFSCECITVLVWLLQYFIGINSFIVILLFGVYRILLIVFPFIQQGGITLSKVTVKTLL